MTTQKRRRRLSGKVEDFIVERALTTSYSPAQILKDLSRPNRTEGAPLPVLRTVERIVKEERAKDTTGPWWIGDYSGEDARAILDVLATVITKHQIPNWTFTNMNAKWVLRVKKAAPGLDPFGVWLIAVQYSRREGFGEKDTTDLDTYLAFQPWQGKFSRASYEKVVESGIARPILFWNYLVIQSEKEHQFVYSVALEAGLESGKPETQ